MTPQRCAEPWRAAETRRHSDFSREWREKQDACSGRRRVRRLDARAAARRSSRRPTSIAGRTIKPSMPRRRLRRGSRVHDRPCIQHPTDVGVLRARRLGRAGAARQGLLWNRGAVDIRRRDRHRRHRRRRPATTSSLRGDSLTATAFLAPLARAAGGAVLTTSGARPTRHRCPKWHRHWMCACSRALPNVQMPCRGGSSSTKAVRTTRPRHDRAFPICGLLREDALALASVVLPRPCRPRCPSSARDFQRR